MDPKKVTGTEDIQERGQEEQMLETEVGGHKLETAFSSMCDTLDRKQETGPEHLEERGQGEYNVDVGD